MEKTSFGQVRLKSKSTTILSLHKATDTQIIMFNLQSLFHTSSSPDLIQVKSSGFQDLHLHNGCEREGERNAQSFRNRPRNALTTNSPLVVTHLPRNA